MKGGLSTITAIGLALAILAVSAPFAGAAENAGADAAKAREPSEEKPAAAAEASPDKRGEQVSPEILRERLHRWQSLTPEQRRKLVDTYRSFQKLPEPTRRRIREQHGQWRRMPQEERRRMRARFREFNRFGAGRRQRLRRRVMIWRSMSQQRRAFIREALAVLKKLPKEKIEELKALPPDQRRKALTEILTEHGVKIPDAPAERGPQRDRGPRAGGEPAGRPASPREGEAEQRGPGLGRRNRQRRGRQE